MRFRLDRSSIVFALLLIGCATSASAQGWGREWFERMSGPGPFAGIGLQFPVGCRWNTSGDQKFFWYFETPEAMSNGAGDRARSAGRLDDASTRRLCIDFQYTSASNKDSAETGLIALRAVEGRVGFPLEARGLPWWAAAFEPSISAGAIRFRGDDFGEWRLTLSPEIAIKPLKFIRPEQGKVQRPNKRGDWRGVIELAYGAVLISPEINNEDLGVTSLPPFEHGWLRRAVFVRVNASELVGLR